jgi:hypothetical protein
VAGVYDASAHTIQVVVNGRPQGAPVVLAGADIPKPTSGPFTVGRTNNSRNAFSLYADAMVDEVRVWQRALSAAEVADEAESTITGDDRATALVADWSFQTSLPTASRSDDSGYGRGALKLTATGARVDACDTSASEVDCGEGVDPGILVLDGESGAADVPGPVVDETGSFTVSVKARLDAAGLAAKPVGYRARIAGQRAGAGGGQSSWGIWFELQGISGGVPAGVWTFGRTGVDANGAVIEQAATSSWVPAEIGTDVDLTGVYDARSQEIRIVVDVDSNVVPVGFAAAQTGGGEFSVGRAPRSGAWAEWLPGGVSRIRVWAGAMSPTQIRNQAVVAQ